MRFATTRNALRFVLAQWSKLSRGLWHALEYAGVFCVNPATSVAMWEDKLTQLVVADQVGLATPVTRYLCDLSAAADFADAARRPDRLQALYAVPRPITSPRTHHRALLPSRVGERAARAGG